MLAGCGGQGAPGSKALRQEATSLQSVAAEGGILATDTARGGTTSAFVRVHAEELASAARASGTVLAKGRGALAQALAVLAGRIRGDHDRLGHSGSDRVAQRRLAAALVRAAMRASSLGKRL